MNKEEFKLFLEENLSSYSGYMGKIKQYLQRKGMYSPDELDAEAANYWNKEVNTYYAVIRAELIKAEANNLGWIEYLQENNILDGLDENLSQADFSYEEINESRRKKNDERGHQITTYEGFTGFVAEDVEEYFYEQLIKQDWSVVPGHWPSMETVEDVDRWIGGMNRLMGHVAESK